MANNALIGALRAEATLESGKFVDGAKKIRTETEKTEAAVKKGFGAMGAAIKGFGGSIMAGLSIGVLTAAAKKAIDYAAALKTTASQLGVTTKELQLFTYAARQVGIKTGEIDVGLRNLGTNLSKAASGSQTAQKAFAAVGVSLEDIKSKSKTEIFGKIADQMVKQGGAAKNAAAGQAIFGEGMSKLVPLLDKGSGGFNELAEAAQRLGIVLSDQQIQNADETARKLEDVKQVLAAQIAGVVADNAASIVTLANALGQLTSAIINFLGSNPQLALAILGGLAGARFGAPGAFGGAIVGLHAGGAMARNMAASNTDVGFRKGQLQKELRLLQKYRSGVGKFGPDVIRRQQQKVNEETARLNQAVSARAAPSAGGIGDLPQFLAPTPKGGGSSRKGRTARGPRDRSGVVAFQFGQEMRRAEMDTLRAQQSLARDFVERAAIARQMLELEREMQNAELDERVRRAERDYAEGRITEATLEEAKIQAENLRIEYDKQHALELQLINEEEELDRQRKFEQFERQSFDIQRDLLQAQSQLATTAAERRKIEIDILNLAYRERKERLERIIRQSRDEDERIAAEIELGNLGRQYGLDRAGVIAATRGPFEAWAASIPQTAAEINEALQSIQVDGFEGIADAITDVLMGTKSLEEAFTDMARSIIAQIIQMTIRMLIFRAIAGAFGGAFGGGTVTGQAAFSGTAGVPGFQHGGGFTVFGRRGIDKIPLMAGGVHIANVSHGERINVANDGGGPARLIVELRDDMLDARIANGADVQIVRAAPRIVSTSVAQASRSLTRPKLMGRR